MKHAASTTVLAIAMAWVALAVSPAHAHPGLTESQARAAVAPFYAALNAAPGKDYAAPRLLATADGVQSCGRNNDCMPRGDPAGALAGIAERVATLRRVGEEAIGRGSPVVVRGEDSRAPSGDFLGVPHADCAAQIQSEGSTP